MENTKTEALYQLLAETTDIEDVKNTFHGYSRASLDIFRTFGMLRQNKR